MEKLEDGPVQADVEGTSAERMARLLNIQSAAHMNEAGLAQQIAQGLPPDAVKPIARMIGRHRVIGPIVSEATYRRVRRAGRRLSADHSNRLYALGRVIDRLAQLNHGDRARMEAFLFRPHPMLNGATPYEMASTGAAGADAVLDVLARAEAGVPA